ncbi:CAP-Gly domain-containing linker protein 1-like isoform X2 [Haliotis cracherodii]|uniref:CAP-Gly domain-containing linker protein 1-like isoform X2 n=1 Tax=Haliotis cracherodii TaxID=6455 RepID=UPI0039EA223A
MSLPRPTGLKAPTKIGRPGSGTQRQSGIPAPGSGSGSRPQSALAKRAAGVSASQAERYSTNHLPHLRGPENTPPAGNGTDDLKIGDRVWVGGTKPGVIAFIGEAQFAPGEWAGVALDEPIGKNDGSVAGVRYFQCEPMKGVFSRLTKLSRTQGLISAPTPKPTDAGSDTSTSQSSAQNGTANHTPARSQTPRIGLSGSKSKSGSNVSLNKDSPPTSTTNLHRGGLAMTKHGVKVGDRVVVSGSKSGILRYVGQTDFAKGEWAGVELDDPQGKNDGAVAGKRSSRQMKYFDCRPNFGLFAPIHKVARYAGGATPSPQTRNLANTSLRSARERSGSQESISSVSSTASSVSRSRVRLGITSLANQASKSGQRPSSLNLSATTSALQKALKEKEEHIEQLLRERDLERAEVARAAAQVDEAEGELTHVRQDKERILADSETQILQLRAIVLEYEKEKKAMTVKLEEERRKVEDLQFQIEEEVISKDDLECRTEEDEAKLRELERGHKREKERADKLEQELAALKEMVAQQQTKLKTADETQTTYLDQMEELTYKLTQAENKIKTFEASRLEEGAKTSQVSMDLAEKTNRVVDLEEALSSQRKEIKQLQDKLVEVQDELTDTNNKKQKMQDNITDLTNKLEVNEKAQSKLSEEVRSLKSRGSDLQRQLATSKDKMDELTDDRNRVEAQLADLMKNSGDNSKQLSLMNDQVAEKTRKIVDLQNDLSSSTQKLAILNETIEQLKADQEKEKEGIVNKSRDDVKVLQGTLEDVQTELDRTKTKIGKLTEDFEKDKVEIERTKDVEITDLRKQLSANAEELEKQELQTQAHKQVLDQITLEREAMKFEKEKAEKNLKRLESDKDAINTELIQCRVELSKLQAETQQSSTAKQGMEEEIQVAKEERERALKAKQELQKQCEDVQAEKEKVTSERNQLKQDAMTTKADIQKKDMQIEEYKKEVEKLKSEAASQQEVLMQKSQTESDSQVLSKDLEDTKRHLTEVQASLKEAEAVKLKMTAELEQSQLVKEERKKLEEQTKKLQSEMEENRKSEDKASLESAKAELQSKVDNSAKDLTQHQSQLESYKKKVGDLETENQSLSGYRASLQSLEKEREAERNQLLDKIHSLEAAVKESKNNANNTNNGDTAGDPVVAQLQSDKEASDKQIEFLNSVIVDMQRKNEEMKLRLQAMEAGVYDNGDAVEGMDISPSRPRSAPRLFCDICDMFDLHDTDDCPKQAMSESPPPTQYHGDRKSTRPYCDICEDDVRQVEGMSSPEAVESPRVSLLPGVMEEDVVALRKWEEGSKSRKVGKGSTRMHSSGHRGGGTRPTAMAKSKRKETQWYKEPSGKEAIGSSAECNTKMSEIAKMRSKLADEVGCDEDELGDWLELGKHARKLQQAIHTADVEIQKQSGLIDETRVEVDTMLPATDHEKNNYREFKYKCEPSSSEQHDNKQISDNVSVVDINQQTMSMVHTDPRVDTNLRMDRKPALTKAKHVEKLRSSADKLTELSEWDNEQCDAEVASMDLEKNEEFEKRLIGLTDEEEELRMFEELEARLEQDNEPDEKQARGDRPDENLTQNKFGSDAIDKKEESFNVKDVSDVSGGDDHWLTSQIKDNAKTGANAEIANVVEQASETEGDSVTIVHGTSLEDSLGDSCGQNNPVCQSPEGLQIDDITESTMIDSENRSLLHTQIHSANASAIVKDDSLLETITEDKQDKTEDSDTHDVDLTARGVDSEAKSFDEASVNSGTKDAKGALKDTTAEKEGVQDPQASLSWMDNSVCQSPDDLPGERPMSCDENSRTTSCPLRSSPSSAVDAEPNDLYPDNFRQRTSERDKDESSTVVDEGGDQGHVATEEIIANPDGTNVDDPVAGWSQCDQQSLDAEYEDAEIDRPIPTKVSHLMLDLIPSSEAGTDVDAPAMVDIEHTDEPSTTDEFETPPSGTSPCVTPPRALSPWENQARRMSTPEADDIVKRRSPKGRVSPTKRFSEGTNKQNKPTNVSQKTDSCVVS